MFFVMFKKQQKKLFTNQKESELENDKFFLKRCHCFQNFILKVFLELWNRRRERNQDLYSIRIWSGLVLLDC